MMKKGGSSKWNIEGTPQLSSEVAEKLWPSWLKCDGRILQSTVSKCSWVTADIKEVLVRSVTQGQMVEKTSLRRQSRGQ